MTENEKKVFDYYVNLGYEVYHVEIWDEFPHDGKIFVDIEIGGSYEKYHHIRGYFSSDEIIKLYNKAGV